MRVENQTERAKRVAQPAYAQVKEMVYGTGIVPDGYFGDTVRVGIAYSPHTFKTFIVTDHGYFNSGLPDAVDQQESEWLVLNHPSSRISKYQPN